MRAIRIAILVLLVVGLAGAQTLTQDVQTVQTIGNGSATFWTAVSNLAGDLQFYRNAQVADEAAIGVQAGQITGLQSSFTQIAAGRGTLAAGTYTHKFTVPYAATSQPVCSAWGSVAGNTITATPGHSTATVTAFDQVIITSSLATDTEQVSWQCEPVRN